jgi:AcrR family transcriptional regulator
MVQFVMTVTAKKPPTTRERLLDLAEEAVLQKGFASTSIDELIAGAGITKSGFFYHFKDRTELARALMLRYLERDAAMLDGLFTRGMELHEDPLHGLLIGLKMFSELFSDLPNLHPGCLAASFAYQDHLFDQEIRALNAQGFLAWRKRFRGYLERIAQRYPPKQEVDLDTLADMATVLVDGGIILSRALKDRKILPDQILLYRNYVRLLFEPA